VAAHVRAELEGIGEAGTRRFGRLSSEMELANARLGSFARKAGIALAAVTVAAAAAGVAMVRSGLDMVGAQADMRPNQRTRRQRHHHGARCRKLPPIPDAGRK